MDVIRVSKTIDAPLRYVYDWCTDFREDDPQITGSKSQRKVLEKTKKRVICVQIYQGADGNQKVALNIVSLKPPIRGILITLERRMMRRRLSSQESGQEQDQT
ncbi:MAG: hypothetical protein OK474_04555 [Thaumarchaeota archaeon]|nr:hypothetical protein [Nitrososphaerota archaeon]